MQARLAKYVNGEMTEEYLLEDSVTAIGRDIGNSIQLMDPSISKAHALIREAGTEWTIEDAGSRNGVFVNGSRIRKPTRLKKGDEVKFGPMAFTFETSTNPDGWSQHYVIDASERAADVTLVNMPPKEAGLRGLFKRNR